MAAGLEASRTPIQNQWRFRATDPLTEKRPVDLNIVLDVVLDGAESASVARLRAALDRGKGPGVHSGKGNP
jgi:hypothetical protein